MGFDIVWHVKASAVNSDIGKENERVYNIKNCIVGGRGGTINMNYI